MTQSGPEPRGTVLIAEDDPLLLRAYGRAFEHRGYAVALCADGNAAMQRLAGGGVSALIADIQMPGMSGIDLLREARLAAPDLPVVIVTGNPAVETAQEAVEFGALKYLVKPVDVDMLVSTVARAMTIGALAQAKREALIALGSDVGDGLSHQAASEAFDSLLRELWVAFQPVVWARDRSLAGYEALLRSREPSLPHPGAAFTAAERLGRVFDLSRAIRDRTAQAIGRADGTHLFFVNLHPTDLLDTTLEDPSSLFSGEAQRLILEITERASLDGIPQVRERVAALRRSGYRIAVDDLGAGYAGLTSLAQLEPEFIKLDMSLIRGINESDVKKRLVASMTRLCQDLKVLSVAEGVETAEERDACVDLGCDLLQGYRFGKPSLPFILPTW